MGERSFPLISLCLPLFFDFEEPLCDDFGGELWETLGVGLD